MPGPLLRGERAQDDARARPPHVRHQGRGRRRAPEGRPARAVVDARPGGARTFPEAPSVKDKRPSKGVCLDVCTVGKGIELWVVLVLYLSDVLQVRG
jgi:hypothetical protein